MRDMTAPRDFLLRLLPPQGIGAEIGVWMGDFAHRLLQSVRPRQLHLIDPWRFEPMPEYAQAWYGGAWAKTQADMDRVHQYVVTRFADRIAAGAVQVHRQSSREAHRAFPDEFFDWVYIDGNHLYEFVKADLANFAPKVKPGGLLCGDDYGIAGWWQNGVQRAVDEFVQAGRCEFLGSKNGQFILRKPHLARDFCG